MANTNDIFGARSAQFGNSFSADDAFMTFTSLRGLDGGALGAEIPLLLQKRRV